MISTGLNHGMIRHRVFHHSPFFFSFLNGALDVAGEVGGLLEFKAGVAMLASAETDELFSTSADMVPSEQ